MRKNCTDDFDHWIFSSIEDLYIYVIWPFCLILRDLGKKNGVVLAWCQESWLTWLTEVKSWGQVTGVFLLWWIRMPDRDENDTAPAWGARKAWLRWNPAATTTTTTAKRSNPYSKLSIVCVSPSWRGTKMKQPLIRRAKPLRWNPFTD